jgi:hypothetical protein
LIVFPDCANFLPSLDRFEIQIEKKAHLVWNTYSQSIIADFIRKLKSYLFILLIDKIQKKEIDTSIYSKYSDLYECFHSSFHEKLCISALASTENITFYPVECANTLNLMTQLRFNCMNLTIMNIVNEYYTITNQVNLEPINQRIELVNNNMKNIFTTIDLDVYNPLLTMLIHFCLNTFILSMLKMNLMKISS